MPCLDTRRYQHDDMIGQAYDTDATLGISAALQLATLGPIQAQQ